MGINVKARANASPVGLMHSARQAIHPNVSASLALMAILTKAALISMSARRSRVRIKRTVSTNVEDINAFVRKAGLAILTVLDVSHNFF